MFSSGRPAFGAVATVYPCYVIGSVQQNPTAPLRLARILAKSVVINGGIYAMDHCNARKRGAGHLCLRNDLTLESGLERPVVSLGASASLVLVCMI